jgi:histone H3/H4
MSSESLETLIVKSKVRDYIKEKGLNTSKAVVDGNRLNLRIAEILDNAIQRAKENGRKTVKPRDI